MPSTPAAAESIGLPPSTESLEDMLSHFLVAIVDLAGAQAGAVRLINDDGLTMRLVAKLGLPPELVAQEQQVDRRCGACGLASHTDVLRWVDDLSDCARQGGRGFFGAQCHAMLVISLPHGGQILGVYNLFFASRVAPGAQVLNLLRLVGQLLGLALHNARIERERLRLTVLNERQEMVNEVHDALAQTLAYARMRLPLLSDAISRQDAPLAQKYLGNIKTAVTQVHDNLREVMTYFRTRMDPLGLLHALETIAANYHNQNGIALSIDNTVPDLHLTETQEVQIHYILQEALANIAKHSMARHAVVRIRQTDTDLTFCVEDDGLGMDDPSVATIVTSAQPWVPSNHLGLGIMRSRAARLGASLHISSRDGVGTRVQLSLPRTTRVAQP